MLPDESSGLWVMLRMRSFVDGAATKTTDEAEAVRGAF